MAWEIETSKQVTEWLEALDDASFDQILPAIDALEVAGPPSDDHLQSTSTAAATTT